MHSNITKPLRHSQSDMYTHLMTNVRSTSAELSSYCFAKEQLIFPRSVN